MASFKAAIFLCFVASCWAQGLPRGSDARISPRFGQQAGQQLGQTGQQQIGDQQRQQGRLSDGGQQRSDALRGGSQYRDPSDSEYISSGQQQSNAGIPSEQLRQQQQQRPADVQDFSQTSTTPQSILDQSTSTTPRETDLSRQKSERFEDDPSRRLEGDRDAQESMQDPNLEQGRLSGQPDAMEQLRAQPQEQLDRSSDGSQLSDPSGTQTQGIDRQQTPGPEQQDISNSEAVRQPEHSLQHPEKSGRLSMDESTPTSIQRPSASDSLNQVDSPDQLHRDSDRQIGADRDRQLPRKIDQTQPQQQDQRLLQSQFDDPQHQFDQRQKFPYGTGEQGRFDPGQQIQSQQFDERLQTSTSTTTPQPYQLGRFDQTDRNQGIQQEMDPNKRRRIFDQQRSDSLGQQQQTQPLQFDQKQGLGGQRFFDQNEQKPFPGQQQQSRPQQFDPRQREQQLLKPQQFDPSGQRDQLDLSQQQFPGGSQFIGQKGQEIQPQQQLPLDQSQQYESGLPQVPQQIGQGQQQSSLSSGQGQQGQSDRFGKDRFWIGMPYRSQPGKQFDQSQLYGSSAQPGIQQQQYSFDPSQQISSQNVPLQNQPGKQFDQSQLYGSGAQPGIQQQRQLYPFIHIQQPQQLPAQPPITGVVSGLDDVPGQSAMTVLTIKKIPKSYSSPCLASSPASTGEPFTIPCSAPPRSSFVSPLGSSPRVLITRPRISDPLYRLSHGRRFDSDELFPSDESLDDSDSTSEELDLLGTRRRFLARSAPFPWYGKGLLGQSYAADFVAPVRVAQPFSLAGLGRDRLIMKRQVDEKELKSVAQEQQQEKQGQSVSPAVAGSVQQDKVAGQGQMQTMPGMQDVQADKQKDELMMPKEKEATEMASVGKGPVGDMARFTKMDDEHKPSTPEGVSPASGVVDKANLPEVLDGQKGSTADGVSPSSGGSPVIYVVDDDSSEDDEDYTRQLDLRNRDHQQPFRQVKPFEAVVDFKLGDDDAHLELEFPTGPGEYKIHDGTGWSRKADFVVDKQGAFHITDFKESKSGSHKRKFSFKAGGVEIELKLRKPAKQQQQQPVLR